MSLRASVDSACHNGIVTESKKTPVQFPYRTTVDGEEWVVRARDSEPGAYSFDWVSGPNPGYGFSSKESDGHACTEDELNEAIRGFLADIDPATGFLD